MKRKKDGYLLLENVISIAIISIILLILYYSLFFTYNLKNKLESKIELQQQSNEIMKYIENVIENSKGVISINSKDFTDNEVISVNSIKCRYNDINLNKKDKEISFKKNLNKDTYKLEQNYLKKFSFFQRVNKTISFIISLNDRVILK
ncbi:hypothetical protein SDC9_121397 [bioreactor metagenome]|uniref:Uncharacterized protein n=1 Tax=bioreactor metagenome TaxID=1076179 RepID=A0A645CBV3_9ZZZZ